MPPAPKKKLPQTKLSDDDVQGIRYAADEGMTQQEIAKVYGITQAHVSMIVSFQRRALPRRKA